MAGKNTGTSSSVQILLRSHTSLLHNQYKYSHSEKDSSSQCYYEDGSNRADLLKGSQDLWAPWELLDPYE